jgi:glycosyltransferase involved in cell wall biosynthesis
MTQLKTALPLISVVINNYNYGRYLAQAIRSALAQTYSRQEVIVIDDGSTDNSLEVAAAFGDSTRVVAKANGGQASAFNRRICRGPQRVDLVSRC